MLIETHLHLGGCICAEFIWELAQQNSWKHLGENLDEIRHQISFKEDEPIGFYRFLDKFKILDEIKWTEETIDLSIKHICQNLKKNCIDFAWMDFSINKYMDLGWHKHEAIKFIYDSFERYYPQRVGLILSLKYESTTASQRQYAKLIENPDIAEILMGLDLVGNEDHFNADFYQPIFRDWNKLGKMTRAHVGESGPCSNIISAIEKLNLTNIAHGVKILQAPDDIIRNILDRDITFDLAITSNYLTGIYKTEEIHPCKQMLDKGFKITISSDDPVQCSTDLHKEYNLATKHGLTHADCLKLKETALNNTLKYKKLPITI